MKSVFRIVAMASVATVFAFPSAVADDDLPLELLNAKKEKKQEDRLFYQIPLAKKLEGTAEVKLPDATEWKALEEGKYYPLGTTFRAGGNSVLTVAFGRDSFVIAKDGATFKAKYEAIGTNMRTVYPLGGEIRVKLSRKMPIGKFFVSAPGFTVSNLRGESRYVYKDTGDGDEIAVKCVTDTLTVKGRHFEIPAMHAANEVRIRTSKDVLFTGLYGKGGDCLLKLDQGMVEQRDFDTNELKIVPKFLEWHLSPRTAVRIQRAKPSLSDKLAVSVMTFNADGQMKNRCTFGEGLYQLNTGEQGPLSKAEKAAIAKKAAAAAEVANANDTETSEAEAEESDATDEESSDADSSSGVPAGGQDTEDDFDL